MALTNPLYIGLSDYAQMTHNDNIIRMANEWLQVTSILPNMKFRPSTDALEDVGGYIASMPKGAWTNLDDGTPATKGTWKQTVEKMGMYEDWSEYNEKHKIVLGNNYQVMRGEHDQLHVQSGGIEIEKMLLYGNPDADPNCFLGFMPRLNQLTDMYGVIKAGTNAGKKSPFFTLDAGGTITGTEMLDSILLIAHGPMAACGIYPKNMANNGLMCEPFPFENVEDANHNNKRVAKTHFMWVGGLKIQNRRTVVRIANINTASDTCMKALNGLLLQAFLAIPQQYRTNVSIYANASVIVGYNEAINAKIVPGTYQAAGLQNPLSNIQIGQFKVTDCESMVHGEDQIA